MVQDPPALATSAVLHVTTFESDKNPQGIRQDVTWAQFRQWMAQALPANRAKASLPMWSPAVFEGDRRAAKHVISVGAMVFDVDEAPVPSLFDLDRALAGIDWFAHSSSSATRNAPRWRLVVRLSRPVTAAEHAHMWRVVTERLPFKVGQASKDPSRAWYWPRQGEDGSFAVGGST